MNRRPPKIAKSAWSNETYAVVMLAATLAGMAAVVFFFNPVKHSFYPVCQFHKLTGLNCPGCGATRALYALLHGDILRALRDNVLVLGLGAVAVGRGLWWWRRKSGPARSGSVTQGPAAEFIPAKCLWPILVLALVFAVLRNLPPFWFLSPPPA
jgi:hypothetical protein